MNRQLIIWKSQRNGNLTGKRGGRGIEIQTNSTMSRSNSNGPQSKGSNENAFANLRQQLNFQKDQLFRNIDYYAEQHEQKRQRKYNQDLLDIGKRIFKSTITSTESKDPNKSMIMEEFTKASKFLNTNRQFAYLNESSNDDSTSSESSTSQNDSLLRTTAIDWKSIFSTDILDASNIIAPPTTSSSPISSTTKSSASSSKTAVPTTTPPTAMTTHSKKKAAKAKRKKEKKKRMKILRNSYAAAIKMAQPPDQSSFQSFLNRSHNYKHGKHHSLAPDSDLDVTPPPKHRQRTMKNTLMNLSAILNDQSSDDEMIGNLDQTTALQQAADALGIDSIDTKNALASGTSSTTADTTVTTKGKKKKKKRDKDEIDSDVEDNKNSDNSSNEKSDSSHSSESMNNDQLTNDKFKHRRSKLGGVKWSENLTQTLSIDDLDAGFRNNKKKRKSKSKKHKKRVTVTLDEVLTRLPPDLHDRFKQIVNQEHGDVVGAWDILSNEVAIQQSKLDNRQTNGFDEIEGNGNENENINNNNNNNNHRHEDEQENNDGTNETSNFKDLQHSSDEQNDEQQRSPYRRSRRLRGDKEKKRRKAFSNAASLENQMENVDNVEGISNDGSNNNDSDNDNSNDDQSDTKQTDGIFKQNDTSHNNNGNQHLTSNLDETTTSSNSSKHQQNLQNLNLNLNSNNNSNNSNNSASVSNDNDKTITDDTSSSTKITKPATFSSNTITFQTPTHQTSGLRAGPRRVKHVFQTDTSIDIEISPSPMQFHFNRMPGYNRHDTPGHTKQRRIKTRDRSMNVQPPPPAKPDRETLNGKTIENDEKENDPTGSGNDETEEKTPQQEIKQPTRRRRIRRLIPKPQPKRATTPPLQGELYLNDEQLLKKYSDRPNQLLLGVVDPKITFGNHYKLEKPSYETGSIRSYAPDFSGDDEDYTYQESTDDEDEYDYWKPSRNRRIRDKREMYLFRISMFGKFMGYPWKSHPHLLGNSKGIIPGLTSNNEINYNNKIINQDLTMDRNVNHGTMSLSKQSHSSHITPLVRQMEGKENVDLQTHQDSSSIDVPLLIDDQIVKDGNNSNHNNNNGNVNTDTEQSDSDVDFHSYQRPTSSSKSSQSSTRTKERVDTQLSNITGMSTDSVQRLLNRERKQTDLRQHDKNLNHSLANVQSPTSNESPVLTLPQQESHRRSLTASRYVERRKQFHTRAQRDTYVDDTFGSLATTLLAITDSIGDRVMCHNLYDKITAFKSAPAEDREQCFQKVVTSAKTIQYLINRVKTKQAAIYNNISTNTSIINPTSLARTKSNSTPVNNDLNMTLNNTITTPTRNNNDNTVLTSHTVTHQDSSIPKTPIVHAPPPTKSKSPQFAFTTPLSALNPFIAPHNDRAERTLDLMKYRDQYGDKLPPHLQLSPSPTVIQSNETTNKVVRELHATPDQPPKDYHVQMPKRTKRGSAIIGKSTATSASTSTAMTMITNVTNAQTKQLNMMHRTNTFMAMLLQDVVKSKEKETKQRKKRRKREKYNEYEKQLAKEKVTLDLTWNCERKLGIDGPYAYDKEIYQIEWYIDVLRFLKNSNLMKNDPKHAIHFVCMKGMTSKKLKEYQQMIHDNGRFKKLESFTQWLFARFPISPQCVTEIRKRLFNWKFYAHAESHSILRKYKQMVFILHVAKNACLNGVDHEVKDDEETLTGQAYEKLPRDYREWMDKVSRIRKNFVPTTLDELQQLIDAGMELARKEELRKWNPYQQTRKSSNDKMVGKQINAFQQGYNNYNNYNRNNDNKYGNNKRGNNKWQSRARNGRTSKFDRYNNKNQNSYNRDNNNSHYRGSHSYNPNWSRNGRNSRNYNNTSNSRGRGRGRQGYRGGYRGRGRRGNRGNRGTYGNRGQRGRYRGGYRGRGRRGRPSKFDRGRGRGTRGRGHRRNNYRDTQKFNGKCYECGMPGHMSRECRELSKSQKNNRKNAAKKTRSTIAVTQKDEKKHKKSKKSEKSKKSKKSKKDTSDESDDDENSDSDASTVKKSRRRRKPVVATLMQQAEVKRGDGGKLHVGLPPGVTKEEFFNNLGHASNPRQRGS